MVYESPTISTVSDIKCNSVWLFLETFFDFAVVYSYWLLNNNFVAKGGIVDLPREKLRILPIEIFHLYNYVLRASYDTLSASRLSWEMVLNIMRSKRFYLETISLTNKNTFSRSHLYFIYLPYSLHSRGLSIIFPSKLILMIFIWYSLKINFYYYITFEDYHTGIQ